MTPKITREILESYLRCQSKAHFKLQGERGIRSDYEGILSDARQEVKRIATDKILAHHAPTDVVRNIPLTTGVLRRGAAFLLDPTLEDEHLRFTFDGLLRVDGPSKLGDYHYVPVLFQEGRKIEKQQRLLLVSVGKSAVRRIFLCRRDTKEG